MSERTKSVWHSFGGALKALVAVGALAFALSAQAEKRWVYWWVNGVRHGELREEPSSVRTATLYEDKMYKPGSITINGISPLEGDTYSASAGSFEYTVAFDNRSGINSASKGRRIGLVALNTEGGTYRISGVDTSGQLMILALANCTIILEDGVRIGTKDFDNTITYVSPIVCNASRVTIRNEGMATLYGNLYCPAIATKSTCTLTLENGGNTLYAYAGAGAPAIGAARWEIGKHTPEDQLPDTILVDSPLSKSDLFDIYHSFNRETKTYGGFVGCGEINIRGRVNAYGNKDPNDRVGGACAIGVASWFPQGNVNYKFGRSRIYIRDTEFTRVYANGSPAVGLAKGGYGEVDIYMQGGTLIATNGLGCQCGPIIGAGLNSGGRCNFEITGGKVQAGQPSGSQEYVIGTGRWEKNVTDTSAPVAVTIRGGRLDLANGWGSGIGGDNASVKIFDGTVLFSSKSSVRWGTCSAEVLGGSVGVGKVEAKMKRAGKALACITVEGLTPNAKIAPETYELNTSEGWHSADHVYADAEGKIYLWVPKADYSGKLVVNGEEYLADAREGDVTATRKYATVKFDDRGIKVAEKRLLVGQPLGSDLPTSIDGVPSGQKFLGFYTTRSGDGTKATAETLVTGDITYYSRLGEAEPVTYTVIFKDDTTEISRITGVEGTNYGPLPVPPHKPGYEFLGWFLTKTGNAQQATATTKFTRSMPWFARWKEVGGGANGYTWRYRTDPENSNGVEIYNVTRYPRRALEPAPTGEVVVPSTLDGHTVTAIGEDAFRECVGMTKVTIPSTVTRIGDDAFFWCSNLVSVVMPSSVKSVGSGAFAGCRSLTSFPIKDGVETIGDGAFLSCYELQSVSIPDSVTTIGVTAFAYCEKLTSVSMRENPDRSILDGAFLGCTGLAEGNFIIVGNMLCGYLGSSTSVTVPDGVQIIDSAAFTDVNNILQQKTVTTLTLPESVSSFGKATFSRTGLTTVNLVFKEGSTIDMVDRRELVREAIKASGYTSDVTFNLPRVTATFFVNDGTPYSSSITVQAGEPFGTQIDAVAVPKISDGVFDGWWTAAEEGERVMSATVVRGNTSCYAHWKAPTSSQTYKVTFGKNGGTGGDAYVTATYGQPMPTPRTAPTKTGYVFEGYWTTTGAGGVQYYDGAMKSVRNWDKTAATTLWAKWGKVVSVKVTFGKNGGTGGDDYVTATYGSAMPTPRTAPTQSGWTFAGYWDTLAMDEKGNPKGKQYYDANMKSVRNFDKTAATTLWAKWTNKVTLGKNGGSGGDAYVTCTKGQPMPTRTMPTKTGYAFAGYWTTTGAGGVKYYNADGTSAHTWDKSGSVTLWAKWETAVTVKVTLGKNNGTGGDAYVTCTTGQPMPTPRTAPKRTGWTFDGYWDTLAQDANGNPTGKQYYDKDMKSVRIWDKPSAVTLWAKWTVKVKLGKNGGTGGDDEVVVTFNQPFPKKTMPKRTGYTFGGYFVSSSKKTGQCYNADGTPTSSMKWTTGGSPTVWALWTKTAGCVELPPPVASRPVATPGASVAPAIAEPDELPAGLYSGVLADGEGTFWLVLDEAEEDAPRTAYLYVASDDGGLTTECEVTEADDVLLLTTEDGEVFTFNPAAGTIVPAD